LKIEEGLSKGGAENQETLSERPPRFGFLCLKTLLRNFRPGEKFLLERG